MTDLTWPFRDKKTSTPNMEVENIWLKCDIYSIMRKEMVFSPSPLFL